MTDFDVGFRQIVLFNDATIARFSDAIIVIAKDEQQHVYVRHFVVMEAKKPGVHPYVIGMFDPRNIADVIRVAVAQEYHVAVDLRLECIKVYLTNVDKILAGYAAVGTD